MIYYLPVIIYAGLIFWGSSLSSIPKQFPFSVKDKILHIGEYFIFGFLLYRAAKMLIGKARRALILFWPMLIGGIYAAGDEIHQYFVPGRSCDFLDWLADILGLALGITIIYIMNRKKSAIG